MARFKTERAWLIVLALLSLTLAGCAGTSVKPEQPRRSRALALEAQNTLGQTLTAHYAGLNSLQVYLSPVEAGEGQMVMRLRSGPQASEDLRTASLPLRQVQQPGYYAFQFPALPDSTHKDYYAQMEMQGSGRVEVGAAEGEAYLFGALYQNGQAQDVQLNFSLGYERLQMYRGLAQEALKWAFWWLAVVWLYLLPGWALMDASWPGWRRLGRAEKLGLSAGASLALYPLMLLWTDLARLHLGRLYAWLPAMLSLAWLAWRQRYSLRKPAWNRASLLSSLRSRLLDGSLLLIVVVGLVIFSRFWAIRRVDIPLWGDSYQHAVMAQLMLDHGGLFENWMPYTPYYSLSVHFGFPAQSAALGWLLGMDGAQATLVFGQAANILAVLALLPLALRLSRGSLWAGGATLIVGGLILQMPAYYVNWGRYAQLGGQAILPVAAWLTWDLMSRFDDRAAPGGWAAWIGPLLLSGGVIAGALLTYYRVAFFFFTFMVIWGIAYALPSFKLNWRRWVAALATAAGIAIASLILLLPWYPYTQSSHLSTIVETGLSLSQPVDLVLADLHAWMGIGLYYPSGLVILALLAALWGLVKKQWMLPGLVVWVGLLIAYSAGQVLHLPGANLLSNFSILIAVYIPASLLLGWLAGEAAGWIARRSQPGAFLLNLALLAIALYGANEGRNLVQMEVYSLTNRPDLRAAAWIEQNVDPQARFLVEGFTIYNGTSAVGSDGGWWLPLLGKRANSMPPQYALMNETPRPANYSKKVIALVRNLEKTPPGSDEGLRLLCSNKITHIYIGQTQGKTGDAARQLFAPQDFLEHPAFKLIYHQDRVHIFMLRAEACSGR